MTKRGCDSCYYYESCDRGSFCGDYINLYDDIDDVYVERFIEQRRKEFCLEWAKYISENTY